MKHLIGLSFVVLLATEAFADLTKGIELYNQGKFAEATSELKQVTSKQPGDAKALTYLGLALVKSGKPAEAQEPLQRAIAIDKKNSAEAHYGLGLAYGYLKKLPESIKELDLAVKLDPGHAYAHYNLGLAYYQQKKIDIALVHLYRFVELAPNAPEVPQVKSVLKQLER